MSGEPLQPLQPFYAAYMRSRGLPQTMEAAARVKEVEGSHFGFLAFMHRARDTFPAQYLTSSGAIADHAMWARHIDKRAQIEGDSLIPGCAICGRPACHHSDAEYAGVIPPHSEVR